MKSSELWSAVVFRCDEGAEDWYEWLMGGMPNTGAEISPERVLVCGVSSKQAQRACDRYNGRQLIRQEFERRALPVRGAVQIRLVAVEASAPDRGFRRNGAYATERT